MENKKELRQEFLTGERALFQGKDLRIYDTIFADGESPLKESAGIELYNSMFKWKYPLWYSHDITLRDCTLFSGARAGIWYTDRLTAKDTMIEAPKAFRRCNDITLEHVSFPDAAETLWNCSGVKLDHVLAKGDYFAMNSSNMEIDGLELYGNYSFDGGRNIVIRNSSDLIMKNCKLINTTLAFEYSTVEADITGKIDSVLNPSGGSITADSIGELIIQKDKVDPCKTRIICREGGCPCCACM